MNHDERIHRRVIAVHVDHEDRSSNWPVTVVLSSTTTDPFAISLTFLQQKDATIEAVEWLVGRDVLTDGLSVPAGDGDVRVRPLPEHPDVIEIVLDCPDGYSAFRFNRDQLGCFLADSAHHQFTDITPELEQWLLTLAA